MMSVLVGVASAAGSHLFWLTPSEADTDVTLASGQDADDSPGGGHADTATRTSTETGPTTTQETTSSTPTTESAGSPASDDDATTVPTTTTPTTTAESSTSSTATTTMPDESAASDRGRSSAPAGTAAHRQRVVELVNDERTRAGCDPVRVDGRLTTAAQRHSDDMARQDYLRHDAPDGRSFDERIEDAGYPEPAAENIAMGMSSADAVMDAWMSSDGHRANILNCEINTIGVGVNTSGWYWTQNFGY